VNSRGAIEAAWVWTTATVMACGPTAAPVDAGDTGPRCAVAVVTDIDATLTLSDGEFISQLADPTYEPVMRPEASALFTDYADLGYAVFYVTARGEAVQLTDGRTAREATADWLIAKGFPFVSSRLFLSEGVGAFGTAAVEYKSGVLAARQATGWTFEWAYGDKDTDTLAWQAGGLADDRIWLVGDLAGEMGVNGIPDADAYATHRQTHLPHVPVPCP